MQCPRCGHNQPESTECIRCGIVVAKYQPRSEAPIRPPPAPVGPPPAPGKAAGPGALFAVRSRVVPLLSALPTRLLPLSAPRQRFFHSLARMLSSGIPLTNGLGTIEANSSGAVRQLAGAGRRGIESGAGLSEALRPVAHLLTPVALALIAAGEQTGDLVAMLDELARIEGEKDSQLRGLLAGLAYPLTVLVLSCLIMPLPQLVIGGTGSYVADVIVNLLVLGGVGVGLWFAVAFSGPLLGRLLDRLPAQFERLLFPARTGLFFLIVGACIRSGMSIGQALELAGDVFRSVANRRLAENASARVREGKSLADGLSGLCRAEDRVLVVAGEQAGTMDRAFSDLSRMHLEGATRRHRVVLAVVSALLALGMVGWVASSVLSSYQRQLEAPMLELEREMGREMRGIWNNR